ncbi:DUF58 domain-containing protein [Paracraurococcus ruber]|uniref:DUF58 domain-containing protein n=1 Tax=Paracraurococcus ruber TaxID=77675 RepID=A0ABS1D4E4_9PROT|nr:DUF58 domain-containing protein [Paracraurococcus ruber]MBK1661736.1 DUF58 domain-containing protein [Paracraurococcus ruber]TDG28136.1 DUF58 domain-containing protein [Paracraurococcus ruber]
MADPRAAKAPPAAPPPGTQALRAEALGARLPPLVVQADRVAATVLQGVHGRRRAGQGDAFWQFRPFLPGDAAGRIDWRQSAKSDRLFIRETEWEAAQTIALWSDASRSMEWQFSANRPTKRDRADLLTAALAALALRGGERVRLIGGPPRAHAGRAGLTSLVESMSTVTKSRALPAPDHSLPRHARAVLIGDFMAPLPEIHAAVAALAAWPVHGHILQVLDPEEETLGEGNRAYAGRVLFEWGGGSGGVLVPRVEEARRVYLERLRHHRDGIAGICAAAGWGFLTHHVDQPPQAALLALWQALSPQ